MGKSTGIAWTDHTFSPWLGCERVSAECDHCYAETWAKRSGLVVWGGPRRLTADATWRKVLRWYEDAKARGVVERIFPSLCDPFDPKVPEEWRQRFYGLIRGTHRHFDWMLLTKRAELLREVPEDVAAVSWIGVTVGHATSEWRLKHLADVRPRGRFVSVEPMIGPVNLTGYSDVIDHVTVGGESGDFARPLDLVWVRSIRDWCLVTGTPFLYKQDSGRHPTKLPLLDGRQHVEMPLTARPSRA